MLDTRRFVALYRGRIMAFLADQSGAVIPLVTVSIITMIGMATLAIDLSRLMDLQTQLQKAADAFALAGAAELDGGADAITRADAAIDTLMASRNSDIWGGGAVTVASRTYHSALPATDDLAMGAGGATAADARYVEVAVAPVTVNTFLPATLLGAADNTLTTGATAVAGFAQVICKQTPIYVCSGTGSFDMTNESGMKGKEVVLIAPPGGGFSPGNFGFLDIGCGPSTTCLNQSLGKNNNGRCVDVSTITTTPGQHAAAANYLNTRFGLYEASANSADKTEYSPDVNVRKGYLPGAGGGACNNQAQGTATEALPLPDDSDITPAIKNGTNPYIGNGDVVWGNYSSVNGNIPVTGVTGAKRHQQYLDEIRDGHTALESVGNGSRREKGTPVCATGTADRRDMYAAVVDCASLGGGSSSAPVKAVVKFFLLQPVISTGGYGTMLGEYVEVAEANDGSGVLHDIVQLYR